MNKPTIIRKSTDGMGVVIWWYSNDWRIRRSAPGYGRFGSRREGFTYTVEGSGPGSAPYRWHGEFDTLADARKAICNPVNNWPAEMARSAKELGLAS